MRMMPGDGRIEVLYALIIGCEIGFWVLLLAGLACRYVLRRPTLSSILLIGVPLVDVALLAFTVVDLTHGAQATFAHGLATAYIGFTVAFGPVVIRWADQHFAFRFADGPPPARLPSTGWSVVIHELKLWGRCLLAVAIIYVLLIGIMAMINDPARTRALEIWYRIPLGTVFFWFLFGPVWSLAFFKRAPPRS